MLVHYLELYQDELSKLTLFRISSNTSDMWSWAFSSIIDTRRWLHVAEFMKKYYLQCSTSFLYHTVQNSGRKFLKNLMNWSWWGTGVWYMQSNGWVESNCRNKIYKPMTSHLILLLLIARCIIVNTSEPWHHINSTRFLHPRKFCMLLFTLQELVYFLFKLNLLFLHMQRLALWLPSATHTHAHTHTCTCTHTHTYAHTHTHSIHAYVNNARA